MIVSEPVIRMENIIKRYYIGKPNELQILNGISLSVDQGEFVSIVGESGSGKSTLMNIIGVLDRQTEGTYFLEGKDVNKMDDSLLSPPFQTHRRRCPARSGWSSAARRSQ